MFDGQVVHPPKEFKIIAQKYICARITNINDIDLNLFPFDYDLTMAIVLANANGTVYHRYGGRTHLSPMNMQSLIEIMQKGLSTHQKYMSQPSQPKSKPPQRLHKLINEQLKGKIKATYGCYHCHYVREARQYLAVEAGKWTPEQFWIWPLPKQLGLIMDQKKQYQVKKVIVASPANIAGIKKGDKLQTIAQKRILTKYDIQWILQQQKNRASTLPYSLVRAGTTITGKLYLKTGWKIGDPQDYLWRVRNVFTEHMSKFLPTPGFIGSLLSQKELSSLGLSHRNFALKVTHLNYGCYLAGIRLGDVILGAGGRFTFKTVRDFYHWCEWLRKMGRDINVQLVRQGVRINVMISLKYLNYPKIEQAPQVTLGFIAQELPGGQGLRVGNVIDNSSAEKVGILLGDRIVLMDGKNIRTHNMLRNIVNNKSPGDLVTIKVLRHKKELNFAFVLMDKEKKKSNLAQLTANVRKKGQILTCIIAMNLPLDNHVYSVHKKGFGLPTQLDFRGRGYKLLGPIQEPTPLKIQEKGIKPMWILQGKVQWKQKIKITDANAFCLVLRVYAQVCDDISCHQFLATVVNNGQEKDFLEFRGHFDKQPMVIKE